jgi:tetratricopeptide (TPR) repeat protein
MSHPTARARRVSSLALAALIASAPSAAAQTAHSAGKVPISTASAEAKADFVKGRTLAENLRAHESREFMRGAIAKDPGFALAHLNLANSAPTPKEFFEHLGHAVALAGKASAGERLMILGTQAGANADPAKQLELYQQLVAEFPQDERAHFLLGGTYFGQQDYEKAIEKYRRSTAIAPDFAPAYNIMGYAYRTAGRYPEAEQAFKKYIELIPDDPNPYDSYAELLMKMGRFQDSIANYEKALKVDPNFVASYVGIGNNQMFMDRGAEARKTFARLSKASRNEGEMRQALFWISTSYLHEGATDKALAEVEKMMDIATRGKDFGGVAGDYNLMGNILLEAGRPDEAAVKFEAQLDAVSKADQPAETKEQVRRNNLFNQARVALARKDLGAAKARAKEYAAKVAARKVPFEVRQTHELAGYIALAERKYKVAASELEQANQQDPRVLYHLAVALEGAGSRRARDAMGKAARFNALGGNYGFVRRKALDRLSKS